MHHYIKAFPEALHHPKEDAYLFAKLRMRTSEYNETLDELAASTRQARSSSPKWMRRSRATRRILLGGFEGFAEAVKRFAAHQWPHMNLETKVILPAAQQYLTAEDWSEIGQAFAQNGDPRFNVDADEEFRSCSRASATSPPRRSSAAAPAPDPEGFDHERHSPQRRADRHGCAALHVRASTTRSAAWSRTCARAGRRRRCAPRWDATRSPPRSPKRDPVSLKRHRRKKHGNRRLSHGRARRVHRPGDRCFRLGGGRPAQDRRIRRLYRRPAMDPRRRRARAPRESVRPARSRTAISRCRSPRRRRSRPA